MWLEENKVVLAKEMSRVEGLSIEAGFSGEAYMCKAGENLATHVEAFIHHHRLKKEVTLLVGKGNNGGDAFAAGVLLLNRSYIVRAHSVALSCETTPLCQKQEKLFVKSGGKVYRDKVEPFKGVILDGLLGTGCRGILGEEFVKMIQRANDSGLPILSIDIPSGVDGNIGKIDPIAISATETLFLGLPKLGCFLKEGYDSIGKLCAIDFGMDSFFLQRAEASAYLVDERSLMPFLPPMKRTRHKYEAGYVIAVAGSSGMPGAAMLSSLAALRTGAGIVRLFHPRGMEQELLSSPYELIRTSYTARDTSKMFQELKRANALLIGPGLGRSKLVHTFIQRVIEGLDFPCVIDADGLFLVKTFPKGSILTPHYQEMCRLLNDDLTQELCQKFANQHSVTIVLKGAPTWIYHPHVSPFIVTAGDPGMATAGTGDVLTGMIAALMAQRVGKLEAAMLGVYLHALSGEIAAKRRTSYGMIASDLIEAIPDAFQYFLGKSAHDIKEK